MLHDTLLISVYAKNIIFSNQRKKYHREIFVTCIHFYIVKKVMNADAVIKPRCSRNRNMVAFVE